MSSKNPKDPQLVIGAVPRIDLMPPEVKERAKNRTARVGLVLLIVFALILVGVGYVGATFLTATAGLALAAEQQRTQELLTAQQEFSEVPQVTDLIARAEAGSTVAVSTQIDWATTLDSISATVPASLALTVVTATSVSPVTDLPAITSLTEAPRVVTFALTADSLKVPNTATWLERLRTVPGFAGAWLQSTTVSEAGYTVQVMLNLNESVIVPGVDLVPVEETEGDDE